MQRPDLHHVRIPSHEQAFGWHENFKGKCLARGEYDCKVASENEKRTRMSRVTAMANVFTGQTALSLKALNSRVNDLSSDHVFDVQDLKNKVKDLEKQLLGLRERFNYLKFMTSFPVVKEIFSYIL